MGFAELFFIAVGLSMDSFSVSVCKGLAVKKVHWKHSLLCGLFFGGFQGLMPFIGYYLGIFFSGYVASIDHWIAFLLLSYIGLNMIKESKECETQSADFSLKTMLLLAIATSIDALTIGISFAFLNVDILLPVLLIGVTTFVFSAIGVVLGNQVGGKLGNKAEMLGGIVLIVLGLKILLEHLFG